METFKEYKLTTIKDIFELVPADRIGDCMEELTTLLVQAKGMLGVIETAGEILGAKKEDIECLCPETFTWVDDGKGEIVSNFSVNGEEAFGLKTMVER